MSIRIGDRQLGAIAFNTTPTSDWECGDWMFWHQELVKAFEAGRFKSRIKYAKADAIRLSNKVFSEWWGKMNWSIFSNWCGYNSDFFYYFKNVGLTDHISYVASVVVPILKAGGNVSQSTANVATTAAETVEKVADAAKKTATTLNWVLPVALIGVTGVGLVWAYNTYAAPKKGMSGVRKKKRAKRKTKS